MTIDTKNLTIEKAHVALKAGEYSVSDLVGTYLQNIENKNKEVNAYLEIYDDIQDQIKTAEEIFAKGEETLLTGIPVALKDNILFKDHIASASSKILENYNAVYDSFVVQKLKEQGAIIIGRTNMDEFAMGSSTETSAYGPTKNPIDETRVPGGSSGGAAAAVAGEMALFALGTETCGSVRQPASFCGLVGLKPTYGAISRSGIIAMGSSLDQVGPLGKNVADVETVYNFISKYDKLDSTSIPENKRNREDINLKKVIGVPRDFLETGGIDKEVLKNFEESCQKLKENGYQIIDVSLPSLKYSLAVYYIIMPAEVSSNMARYDGIRYGLSQDSAKLFDVYAKSRGQGFGSETRRRILLGTYILSKGYYDAYYNTALTVRQMIRNELEEIFKKIDVFMTPTVPFLPFKFGEKLDNPLAMYLCDIFSAPANLADVPAISIPSGRNEQGLPFGIQFTGPYLGENTLFSIGKDFEKII